MKSKARKILDSVYPGQSFELEYLGDHQTHETFSAVSETHSLVLKLCDNDWSAMPDFEKGFAVEPLILEALQDSEVPVPKLVEYTEDYILMEKIPGGSHGNISFSENRDAVKQAGKILGNLHNRFSFDSAGGFKTSSPLTVEPMEWPEMYREIIWQLSSMLEKIDAYGTRDRIRKMAEDNLGLIEDRDEFVLVHQEFSPRNLVGDEKGINAVVDWERAISGDPEYDLFTAEKHLLQAEPDKPEVSDKADEIRKTLIQSYREERELADGWRKRRRLYQLPYITIMMYVMKDENDEIRPELYEQLAVIESKLK
ncbi:phosphotransferase family protein [Candidatus Nanohalococcus occultus]|uniref:Aminoglycoside phosphotransferase n=1 Tax=Candidatus Nanohalococcus occultus TaxID=2978047 RepID=A0ABY8CE11_9ARCH|nr:Putative aminoglycoside phosphotransferase [Candidatus Nanohaloarchaeota archaeon SVXNc]